MDCVDMVLGILEIFVVSSQYLGCASLQLVIILHVIDIMCSEYFWNLFRPKLSTFPTVYLLMF